jgi:dTDP-4-dehydrorhamnose 3,5-epimerase
MIFKETKLKGSFIIEIERLEDQRGFFARGWCKMEFESHGLESRLVQANISLTKKKGTLRGLHYQVAPHEETKLIRCTRGSVYDVVVDLRPNSPTYMQWLGVELSADNYRMLYVPRGDILSRVGVLHTSR